MGNLKKYLFVFLILLLSCSTKYDGMKEYKINLESDSLGKYKIEGMGVYLRPSDTSSRFYEKIIKRPPKKYKIINTYNICLQRKQNLYNRMCSDPEFKKKYINDFDIDYNELEKKYSKDSIDCIVSICQVKDSSENEYWIFDHNNDENFKNDSLRKFNIKTLYNSYRDTTYKVKYVDSESNFEYYDGSVIQNSSKKIRIGEIYCGLFYAPVCGGFGKIKIGGKNYKIGIHQLPVSIEYDKYHNLWIDRNHDNKFQAKNNLFEQDIFEQMYLPFTLDNGTYIVSNIDKFGCSITIKKCNPDSFPPIAKGLPAPDFTAVTIDSTEIKLSEYNDQCIILDFWACNRGPSVINEVYKKYKNNPDVKIISFYPTIKYSGVDILWAHIDGDSSNRSIRKLYQVGGGHTTIIIDKNGKVVNKVANSSKENICRIIRRQI